MKTKYEFILAILSVTKRTIVDKEFLEWITRFFQIVDAIAPWVINKNPRLYYYLVEDGEKLDGKGELEYFYGLLAFLKSFKKSFVGMDKQMGVKEKNEFEFKYIDEFDKFPYEFRGISTELNLGINIVQLCEVIQGYIFNHSNNVSELRYYHEMMMKTEDQYRGRESFYECDESGYWGRRNSVESTLSVLSITILMLYRFGYFDLK